MTALVCDLCGGKLIMGAGGIAVCDSCGMGYSSERMKEKVQEIKGTVKIDNTHLVENYLKMARSAYASSNNKEAEDYANKIIEIDPQNADAWDIKGRAAGWQTTGGNNRFPESISCWRKALLYAPAERRGELEVDIVGELTGIALGLLKLHCGFFTSISSEENKDGILNKAKEIKELVSDFVEATNLTYDMDLLSTAMGRAINSCVVEASNKADKSFGPELSDRTKWSWNNYTAAQDLCLKLLDKAYDYSCDAGLDLAIAKNYIAIATVTRDSCSYKFEANSVGGYYAKDYSFTDKAKKSRTSQIEKWEKKRDANDPDKRKAGCEEALSLCREARGAQEKAAGIAKYWAEHQEEKAALEREKGELTGQAEQLRKEKEQIPQRAEAARIQGEIDEKKDRQKSLGLFKGSEKKALQAVIDQLSGQLSDCQAQLAEREKELDGKLSALQARGDEIDSELTRDRGAVPLQHHETFRLCDETGCCVTPIDLLDYCGRSILLPFGVPTGGVEDIINFSKTSFMLSQAYAGVFAALAGQNTEKKEYVDDPNELKTWSINIVDKTISSDNQSTGIDLRCSALSISDPIQADRQHYHSELYLHNLSGIDPKSVCQFATIGAYLVFGLCPSSDFNQIQEFLVQAAYRTAAEQAQIVDGFKLKVHAKSAATLYISRVSKGAQ